MNTKDNLIKSLVALSHQQGHPGTLDVMSVVQMLELRKSFVGVSVPIGGAEQTTQALTLLQEALALANDDMYRCTQNDVFDPPILTACVHEGGTRVCIKDWIDRVVILLDKMKDQNKCLNLPAQ